MAVSDAASMYAKLNRMEYRRPGITEWFVNGKEGVEQGFTIPQRPAGNGEPLVLRLRVRGGLVAADGEDGAGILFRTADGANALYYRKLVVSDANDRRVPLRMAAHDGLINIVVDDRRAMYPLTLNPIAQQAYLKASNRGGGDRFGSSVAISGDTVVVGAYGEASNSTGVGGDQSNNSANYSGAAYVFVRSGTTWNQEAYLKASNTGGYDSFGHSVAIDEDTVVVGAWGEASNATLVNVGQSDNAAVRSGATYVFVRSGTNWSQEAYLKASNTASYDAFGISVAISEDTIVVGAAGEASKATGVNGDQANDSAGGSGAAYVFTRSRNSWRQQAYLKASNTEGSDSFGKSVAISGDTAVVGAPFEDSSATGVGGDQTHNAASNSGAVYVFARRGNTWSQQAYLKASITGGGDLFGGSVAISESTMVTGAYLGAGNATGVGGNGTDTTALHAGASHVIQFDVSPTPAGNTRLIEDVTGATVLASAGNCLS